MARIIFSVLLIIGLYPGVAQDNKWMFLLAILPGVYTHDQISLRNNNPLIIGLIPFSRKNLYGELRYNYDFKNTLGLYLGRSFKREKKTTHILTPQLGLLNGDFKGLSYQLYYQVIGNNFEVNYQNQFSLQNAETQKKFYYNWSDVQLVIKEYFRLGGSVQFYRGFDKNYLDPGLLAGYRTPRLFVVLFDFNFHDLSKHYFFLGLQYTITK